jgi:hypothetical protein
MPYSGTGWTEIFKKFKTHRVDGHGIVNSLEIAPKAKEYISVSPSNILLSATELFTKDDYPTQQSGVLMGLGSNALDTRSDI